MSLDDTLAAIDAATGCQWCQGALGASPSRDFCGEACQGAWHGARADRLPVDPYSSFRQRYVLGLDQLCDDLEVIDESYEHVVAALLEWVGAPPHTYVGGYQMVYATTAQDMYTERRNAFYRHYLNRRVQEGANTPRLYGPS